MNTSPTPAASPLHTAWMTQVWSVAAGFGFTGVIAAGLAHFSSAPPMRQAVDEHEVRSVEIPEPPPPPPPPPTATAPLAALPPDALDFDLAPNPGGIPLAVSLQSLAPPAPQTAVIRFDIEDLGDYRPAGDLSSGDGQSGQRVYRIAEVDRRPVAVYRVAPKFYASSIRRFENPFVELLFILSPNGIVEDIQVLHAPTPDLAEATIAALREWKFRPAMKGGKKVRCLVQQTFNLRVPDSLPFSR